MAIYSYEAFYNLLKETNVEISHHECHNARVTLMCEFFYDELNYVIERISYGMCHIDMVAHLYVFFDVL
jgi:hypothetical protein